MRISLLLALCCASLGLAFQPMHSPVSRFAVRREPAWELHANWLETWLDDVFPQDGQDGSKSAGAGLGVVDLRFESLKPGGFKAWCFFQLLGQGQQDKNNLFTVRQTSEGIRIFLQGSDPDPQEYQGVLDLSWGLDPSPFFKVDRIDPDQATPYPQELVTLDMLLDAMLDVYGEEGVDMESKLFTFPTDANEVKASVTLVRVAFTRCYYLVEDKRLLHLSPAAC
ncbi:unnamed protein product [Chrysoparadoxa australica]